MLEMVEARKDVDKVEERYDLFSGLLDAAQDEPGSEAALSDDELIGWYPPSVSLGIQKKPHLPSQETCLFFFLLDTRWDHFRLPPMLHLYNSLQTTAHTLCFSFALLALHPDEQESLYQHIKSVISSSNGMPVGSCNLKSYRGLTSP
jgi:hypothetical protein